MEGMSEGGKKEERVRDSALKKRKEGKKKIRS